MRKKLFTLLLAVAASVGTMFAEPVQIGDLYYNLDATNQTAEVTYQYQYSSNNYSGLTAANIPASVVYNEVVYSVTSIGESAFGRCYGLTSVTIPGSVTYIGNAAFLACSGLSSVTIPNSVTSIGNYAFSDCSGLTSLSVEAGNTVYDSRNNCNAIIETSTNTLIFGCQNTTISNSVTSIGESAFAYCSGLTSVTIPHSVTSIGSWAFSQCDGLTSVTIPNSVTSIGEAAFSGCSGLTSVTNFANTPQEIGSYVFDNVDKSTCVLYVPAGSVSAYKSAEGWKEFTNILPISQQGFEDVQGNNVQCTKVVRDGQIFILRGQKVYNAQGALVK